MTKLTNQLAKKVQDAIFQNENFNENWKIEVMENGGVITLVGTVPTKADRDLMESIANKQEGVISVVNELNIKAFTEKDLNEEEAETELNIPPTRRQTKGPIST